MRKTKPVLTRLFAKTIIPLTESGEHDTTKCWNWNGGTNNAGYGLMRVPDELNMILVHRVSYIEHNKNMRYNCTKEVLHQCSNKLCVNPHHLKTGTVKDRHDLQRKFGKFNNKTFKDKAFMNPVCEHCGESTYRPHFKRKHSLCEHNAKHKYNVATISGKNLK